MTRGFLFILIFISFPFWISAQIEFADEVVDQFYSGANPNFDDFYGNNPASDLCNIYLVDVADHILGDNDSIVALPEGSFITLAFTDNLVFDAPDQDDLFIEEIGGGQEFGQLFVSPDGIEFTFLDILNGSTLNSFDLNDYAYDDVVKVLRIVGNDSGGCIPGLDISRVFGVEGANCFCGADLARFPFEICNQDTVVSLEDIPQGEVEGVWIGPGVVDGTFNPLGMEGEVTLQFIVNFGHAVCPADTVDYKLLLARCDCEGLLDGPSEIDDCGLCLQPEDPQFNRSCLDCVGLINGTAVIDSCGQCLEPSDPEFNMSCFDCLGILDGPHVIDLCDNCLLESDPLFNLDCPERFRVYIPNVFTPNSGTEDSFFGLQHNENSLGHLVLFEIYDRYGSLLFQLEDIALVDVTEWWDGRDIDTGNDDTGNDYLSGVYSYQYRVTYPEFPDDVGVGTVALIK